MLLGCDKFLDRVGGGGARPRLPGPAGACQPVVCRSKAKEKHLPTSVLAATSPLLPNGEPNLQSPTRLCPALSQTWLEQMSPHPTGGKGLL